MIKFFLTIFFIINFAYAETKPATCPAVKELYKNEDSIWITKSNWRSFNPSFIENITHFSGAQWQGEKIGQLLCTYDDDTNYTFPVTLQSPFLSIAPTGKFWKMSKDGKLATCTNAKITDCVVEKVNSNEQKLDSNEKVIEFLQSIRSKN